jgi:hypothetical protein
MKTVDPVIELNVLAADSKRFNSLSVMPTALAKKGSSLWPYAFLST